MDPAWSALVENQDDRGLLDDTLVIWMGEFGRTVPRVEAVLEGLVSRPDFVF